MTPKDILGRLYVCVGVLVLVGAPVDVMRSMRMRVPGELYRLLTLDGERSIQATFSAFVLSSAAVLLWQVHRQHREIGHRFARRWALFSGIMAYAALDELLAFHEWFIRLREPLGLGGILYWAWIVPAMALLLLSLPYFVPMFLVLPRSIRTGIARSAAIYLGGAVGVESITGILWEDSGRYSLAFPLLVSLEETMEMLGACYFVYTLASFLTRDGMSVTVGTLRASIPAPARARTSTPPAENVSLR